MRALQNYKYDLNSCLVYDKFYKKKCLAYVK